MSVPILSGDGMWFSGPTQVQKFTLLKIIKQDSTSLNKSLQPHQQLCETVILIVKQTKQFNW